MKQETREDIEKSIYRGTNQLTGDQRICSQQIQGFSSYGHMAMKAKREAEDGENTTILHAIVPR